jgi:flavin-dependent dehydrogenase
MASTGPTKGRYDVAILGGGLAGLTLALQLKRERPETSVLVVEKREGPAPEAAFKVGESTLDLSAWYFGEVLELKDHLERDQLPKCGLRFFFPANGNRDIARRVEWGQPFWSPLKSYQLDRGRFENELARRCRAAGVDLVDGWTVDDVELGDEHRITSSEDGSSHVAARWVVDALGRAALLKRKLGLERDVPHKINSSWFRLRGGLDIEDWSDDQAWLGRMPERGMRKFSTNHLMGEGYWVWLIPLASGSISIGIVADPRYHPYEEISTLDGALGWLGQHEPQLHDAVAGRRDDVQDFLRIRDFSLGAERVFSSDRWCLTGEAGVFLDPLYSPGSDFICLSNLLIGDLIGRDLAGEDVAERADAFNAFYLHFFERYLVLYQDQYELFGNALAFSAKHVYNAASALSALLLFFDRRIAEVPFNQELRAELDRLFDLIARVEPMFRAWHRLQPEERRNGFVFPVTFQPLLGLMNVLVQQRDPSSPRLDDDALLARMRESVAMMEGSAVVLFHHAAAALPGGGPGPTARVNPYAISLDPERWEADGLVSDDGLTLDDARARATGIEGVLDMARGDG